MKRETFSNDDEWKAARLGVITGSKAKNITPKVRGTGLKIEVYRLISERIGIPRDENENRMDRGHSLEAEAVERLAKETGLPFIQVDNELWTREDLPNIGYSPDGYVPAEHIEIAAEVKCKDSAIHVMSFITQEIPSEFDDQVTQAFVTCDTLKTLYFVMYDPSMPKDFIYFVVNREDVAEKVAKRLEDEKAVLEFVDGWVSKLTF